MIGDIFPDTAQTDFQPILRALLEYNDAYFVLQDFGSYARAQEKVDGLYRDRPLWSRMSLVNIAMSGHFSSDNTIRQYAEEIWKIRPTTPLASN
jgi:starch phosphorylase